MAESLGSAVLELRTDSAKFNRGIDRARSRVDKLGKGFLRVGKALAGFGVAVTGVAALTIKMATDFNKSMANVATLIPGNIDRVNELKSAVQGLAVAHGKDTADLAQGLYQTISAFGDKAGQTVKILEINSRAAAAGLATTTEAIDLTASITKAYGDTSAEAVSKVADLALMTVRLGQTDFPALARSMGKVTPIAQAMGQSQEDLFAVFATATGVVGKASEVSTQYRGILASLLDPTEDMIAVFGEMDVETGKAALAQEGLVGVLERVVAAAEKSGQPITKYISQIEAVPLALALAGPQADTFRAKLEELGIAAGAVDIAFKEQTEGINAFGFQMAQFQQQLAVLGQQMGNILIPVVQDFVKEISGYLQREGPMIVESFGVFLVEGIDLAIGGLARFGEAITFLKRATNAAGVFISELSLGFKEIERDSLVQNIARIEARIKDLGHSTEGLTRRLAEDKAALAELDLGIVQTEGTISAFNDQFNEAIRTGGSFQSTLKAMRARLAEYKRMIEEATAATLTSTAATKTWVDAIGKLPPVIKSNAEEVEKARIANLAWGTAAGGVTDINETLLDQLVMMEDEWKNNNGIVTTATKIQGDWFNELNTGIPVIDKFLGKMKGFLGIFTSIGGLLSSVSKGFAGFFSKITGVLGGGGGGIPGLGQITSLLGGLLGGVQTIAAPAAINAAAALGIGGAATAATTSATAVGATAGAGMLSGITGAISSGASAVGGAMSSLGAALVPLMTNPFTIGIAAAIGGFFLVKKIFGKPNKLEKEGRKTAASFTEMIGTMLGEAQRAEIAQAVAGGASEAWARKVIGLRDTMLALGKTEKEALAISEALWAAEKQGPEAVQKVIDGIRPSLDKVQEAMKATGLSLTELRNTAINKSIEMGITVAEAFAKIADGTIDMVKKSADEISNVTDTAVRDAGRVGDAFVNQRDRISDTFRDFTIPVNFNLGDLGSLKGLGGDIGKSSGVTELAHGAVVTEPTVALIGEGGRDEAVLPLNSRGGLSGGMMQPIVIEIEGERLAEITLDMQSRVLHALGID